MNDRAKLRKDLVLAVQNGLDAEAVSRFLLNPIRQRRDELISHIESGVYLPAPGQPLDSGVVIMPHLEMKMLRQIEAEIAAAIKLGEEAQERLRDMDKPSSAISPKLHF